MQHSLLQRAMAASQAEPPVYNTTHNRVQSDAGKQSLNNYVHSYPLYLSLSIAVGRPISFPHALRDVLSLSHSTLKARVPQRGLSRVAQWVWASLVWEILKTATVTSTAFCLVTAAATSTTSAHLVTQQFFITISAEIFMLKNLC